MCHTQIILRRSVFLCCHRIAVKGPLQVLLHAQATLIEIPCFKRKANQHPNMQQQTWGKGGGAGRSIPRLHCAAASPKAAASP